MRIFPIAMLFCLTSCASGGEHPVVRNYGPNEQFSTGELLSGSVGTEAQCARTEHALWVVTPAHTDCLRYYLGGDAANAPVAEVYLEGDRIGGKVGQTRVSGPYNLTPSLMTANAQEQAQKHGIPYFILARPGTFGSSGNQNDRRQQTETLEINAALDQLKSLYSIQEWGIVGQSGGGGLVGALIAERSDVLCAVSTSGVLAVAIRNGIVGTGGDVTGYSTFWDPITQVKRVHQSDPNFRLFLVGDKLDSDVPFASLLAYSQAAGEAGLNPIVIQAHGTGPSHHGLFRVGIPLTADCLKGKSTAEIINRYQAL